MCNMDVKDVPLLALSIEAQTMLSTLLNPTKVIPTESNLPRDWRGIAELAGVPSESIALFEAKSDPFKELLGFLTGSSSRKLSIDDFKALLGVIDRFDVLEDVTPVTDRDVVVYKEKLSNVRLDRKVGTVDTSQDSNILTYEDALRSQKGLPLCRYDAFILYSDDDSSFAFDVIQKMEKDYSLTLCSKDRDLLPGLKFEHEVIGKMIEERCNRLLVIFSPSFLESPANQFLVSYAQAIALDTRCRKIIPCVYKKCELPPSVRYSFCIDYNRSGKLWNFWEKLGQSLVVPTSYQASKAAASSSTIMTDMMKHADGKSMDSNPSMHEPESWDADKSLKKPALATVDTPDLSRRENYPNLRFDEQQMDTISMHSQAQLLPNTNSVDRNKSSNWFSKLMSPMNKKKRSDKEKSKQKAMAE